MKREELIKFRKKKGYTQKTMANMWNISISFYKQIEAGLKNPSLKKMKEFKNIFPTTNIMKFF